MALSCGVTAFIFPLRWDAYTMGHRSHDGKHFP